MHEIIGKNIPIKERKIQCLLNEIKHVTISDNYFIYSIIIVTLYICMYIFMTKSSRINI